MSRANADRCQRRHIPPRARAVISAALLASVVAVQLVAAPPAAAACAPGELEPTVTLLVSQGASDYTALTRGRSTLVQALMTLPACADSTDSITLNSVAVTVDNAGETLRTFSASIGRGLPPCCAVDATNTQLYPRFVVAADEVAPAGTEKTGFAGTVTSTIRYTANGVAGEIRPTKTVFFAGDQELTVQFVRLGNTDPGSGVTNWTSTDSSTFSTALATFQRLLPIHNSGFRWRLEPEVLNLGQGTAESPGLDVWEEGSETYCGDQTRFLAVGAALQQRWLAARTYPLDGSGTVLGSADPPPDVTVGVISERLVSGCTERGRALLGGNAAYFVLRSDNGGAIAAHEVAHLFGSPHAGSNEADPNRLGYNVPGLKFLGGAWPLMHAFTPFTNENALAQAVDWALAQCHMGGGAGCATPSMGTPAATGRTLKIAGTTDGSFTGTRLNSHVGEAEEATSEDPTSPFVLVYRDGSLPEPRPSAPTPAAGQVLASFHVPHAHESIAAASSSGATVTQIRGEFDWHEAATVVELYQGDPASGGVLLYQRGVEDVSVDTVEVTASEWTFEPFTHGGADEFDPALSPDGALVVHVGSTGQQTDLTAAPVDAAAAVARVDVSAFVPVTHPTVSGRVVGEDGRVRHVVAFVCDEGDLCITELDLASMSFTEIEKIYSCADLVGVCVLGGLALVAGDVSGPSFLPAGAGTGADQLALVLSLNGDLFRVQLDGLGSELLVTARRLTDTPGVEELEPTGGPVGLGQRIAYRRPTDRDGVIQHEIWTLELSDPTATQTRLLCCGFDPSWGGDVIAYEHANGDARSGETYHAVVSNPRPQPLAEGTTPSLLPAFGDTLALVRGAAGSRDVFLGRTTTRRDITVTGRSSRPEETRAFFWVCSNAGRCTVIAADLPVRQVDPANDPTLVAATLDDFDTTHVPGGWKVVAGLSTGIEIAFGAGGELTDNRFEPQAVFVYPGADHQGASCDVVPVWAVVQDPSQATHAEQEDIVVSLTGPGLERVVVGDGSLRHLEPAAVYAAAGRDQGCWSLGAYELRADSTGSNGAVSSATARFSITGTGSRVVTRPETLNISSSGTPVTVYIDLEQVDEATITSAAITRVCHVPVEPIQAYQLVTEGDDVTSPKVAVAKFDRSQVNARIQERVEAGDCTLGRYAPLTIEGSGGAGTPFTFSDTDPSAPVITS